MKKIFILTVVIAAITGISNATCSINDINTVCTANDTARIREPYKPIYNDYGRSADFGGDPFVRLSPANRNNVDRNFKNQNPQQEQKQYNANCQFGVCLPSNMSSTGTQ